MVDVSTEVVTTNQCLVPLGCVTLRIPGVQCHDLMPLAAKHFSILSIISVVILELDAWINHPYGLSATEFLNSEPNGYKTDELGMLKNPFLCLYPKQI